jgi:hypothetical protein
LSRDKDFWWQVFTVYDYFAATLLVILNLFQDLKGLKTDKSIILLRGEYNFKVLTKATSNKIKAA